METLVKVAAVVSIFSLAVKDVSGIHCFQCNSYFDKGCEDISVNDTTSEYYKECVPNDETAGKELFCRKTHQLILDVDFPHERVVRSCGWVRHPKYHCYNFKNKGHEEESCTCYHDACNSAFPNLPLPQAALVSVLTSLYCFLRTN